jgi:DNA-binding transcriptional LysR family regulator
MGLVRPVGIERPGVVNSCILREDYVLALPSEHPLARKRKVGIHDLNGEDFVMYSPTEGRYGFEILVSAFRAAAVEPRFVQHVTHTHSILALVNSGMGLALVPASASNVQFGSLVFKAIDLGPNVFAELFLSTQEKNANPAADLLLAKLQRLLVR